MSRSIVDGIWIITCDWKDESKNPCNLGLYGEPKTFVDPDGRHGKDTYYQCGNHHGVVKQEDKPEYQLDEDERAELKESTLLRDVEADPDKDVAVRHEGLNPETDGKVWDGNKDSIVWDKET